MQVPLHPMIVHFPIALTFILPVLVVIFACMIKTHKMAPKAWLIIIGLQFLVVGTGYISLETGETEEDVVAKVVPTKLVNEHEEAAEIFVGASVLGLVFSVVAFFIRKEFQFPMKLGIAVLGLISCYLSYRTARLGGELVYQYNAGSAYGPEVVSLPTPPQTTTLEAPLPEEGNESLKADDNDYGNADEVSETPDDDLIKQED